MTLDAECPVCRDLNLDCKLPKPMHQVDAGLGRDGSRLAQSFLMGLDSFSDSRKKCPKCAAIWQMMLFFSKHAGIPAELFEDGKTAVVVLLFPLSNPVLTPVWWDPVDRGRIQCQPKGTPFQIYTPLGSRPAWKGLRCLPEIRRHGLSQESLRFIRESSDDCYQAHQAHCQQKHDWMPTRLLDVRPSENEGVVRLVETSLLSEIEPYVALSYCWGTAGQVKTEKGNIDQRKTGIDLAALPRTIRDSITVTRELGRRFIWVDALCIIQDDNDDWEREAAQMAQVYSKADLTIAASSASLAAEGFLASGKAEDEIPEFEAHMTLDDGTSTVLKARNAICNQTHHYKPEKAWSVSFPPLPEDPLNERAWTLQEGLLSTRTVIFSQREIEWHCKSSRTCQCGYLPNLAEKSREISPFRLDSPKDAFSFWQKMVEQNYSKRLLTFRKDKLPALSGVASVVQKITGSMYLSGMWKDNIVEDLSWRVEMNTPDKFTRLKPRADAHRSGPTFSWASSDDNVYFVGLRTPMVSFVDGDVTLAGQNPLGEVNGGWIELKGRACEAEMRLLEVPGRPSEATFRVPGFHDEGTPGFRVYRFDLDHAVRCFSYTDAEGKTRRSTASWYATDSTAGSSRDIQWEDAGDIWSQVFPVKLMLLGDGARTEAMRRIGLGLYLILGVSPEQPHRAYERIGLASVTIQNLGDDFWRAIRRGEDWVEESIVIV